MGRRELKCRTCAVGSVPAPAEVARRLREELACAEEARKASDVPPEYRPSYALGMLQAAACHAAGYLERKCLPCQQKALAQGVGQ